MLVILGGCASPKEGFWGPVLEVSPPNSVMGKYDVKLSTGRLLSTPEMTDKEVEVDVIALTNKKYCQDKWFEYDLTSYFDADGDKLRDGSPVWRATFSTEENEQILAADHPIWSVWESTDATHLVIIAEGSAEEDSRRMVIPLDRSRWLEDDIEIRLMSGGLVLRSRRLPPWPGQPNAKFKEY
jgi:hypothetical protein